MTQTSQVERHLHEWAEQIGIPFGTFKDWGYRLLKKRGVRIKSPCGLKTARQIAAIGKETSLKARGFTKKAALSNYQKCSDFLESTYEDVQR